MYKKGDLQVGGIMAELDAGVWRATREMALFIHGRVSERTPVDTGTARANWNLFVGEPDDTVRTRPAGAPPARAVRMTSALPADGPRKVYITNNIPYIVKLERGGSRQAPAGMVDVTLAEIEAGIL